MTTTSDNYRARAQAHAPITVDAVSRAARELAQQGHSDHTIAAILRLDIVSARQMIGPQATQVSR